MSEPAPTALSVPAKSFCRPVLNEDWLALALGLGLFLVALLGVTGHEPFGWGIKTNVWLDPGKILTPMSAKFAKVSGLASLGLTYIVMALVLGIGAGLLGARRTVPGRFYGYLLR